MDYSHGMRSSLIPIRHILSNDDKVRYGGALYRAVNFKVVASLRQLEMELTGGLGYPAYLIADLPNETWR